MRTTPHRFKRARSIAAFTLIELMITMAIIGILAAIAFPSYQSYVTRTHRAAAKACLSEYSQFMERYYTTRMTYVGADAVGTWPVLGCTTDGNLNQSYAIEADGAFAQGTYRIRARPIGVQATRDAQCGTLALNNSGQRFVTGASGVSYCW